MCFVNVCVTYLFQKSTLSRKKMVVDLLCERVRGRDRTRASMHVRCDVSARYLATSRMCFVNVCVGMSTRAHVYARAL